MIDLKNSSSFAPSSSQIPFSNKKVVSSTDSSKTVSNPQSSSVNPSKNVDVDTFVPDDGDFNNFLEESDISKEKTPTSAAANTVDSRYIQQFLFLFLTWHFKATKKKVGIQWLQSMPMKWMLTPTTK